MLFKLKGNLCFSLSYNIGDLIKLGEESPKIKIDEVPDWLVYAGCFQLVQSELDICKRFSFYLPLIINIFTKCSKTRLILVPSINFSMLTTLKWLVNPTTKPKVVGRKISTFASLKVLFLLFRAIQIRQKLEGDLIISRHSRLLSSQIPRAEILHQVAEDHQG